MAINSKTILSDIVQKFLDRLKSKGLESVKTFEIKKGTDNAYVTPAVRALIASGKFSREGQEGLRCNVVLHSFVIFKHVSDEMSRQKGIYPIVMGLVQLMFGQQLGISIAELDPISFQEVTNQRDEELGLIVYLVAFTTNFSIEMLDEEEAEDLLSMGLSYYLKPGTAVTATDEVTITP